MIGCGKYHLDVPRDLEGNLAYREKLIRLCSEEPQYQAAVIEMCRQDILYFIGCFIWQINPTKRVGHRVGPFIPWDFQGRALLNEPPNGRGIIWCYENDRSAVVEKSREMGASWLFLIVQVWLCLFHQNTECMNISLSADAVDSKLTKSLFWKIRFIHANLPNWLKGEITEEKMYFGYERSQSFITGEASTGRATVGGRAAVVFVDEFSQIREDKAVRTRTASTANCRFFNGTHLGTGTEFYQLTVSPEFVKIQMHWVQHPDKNQGLYSYDLDQKKLRFWEYDPPTDKLVELKDGPKYLYPDDYEFVMDGSPNGGINPGIRSPWYDWKCKEVGGDREAAVELDVDPEGSVEQFFKPLLIHTLKNKFATPPLWTGTVEHKEGKLIALHKDQKGRLKLWLNLRPDGKAPIAPYGGGVDVSQGTGATPSCLTIADAVTGSKLLEYCDADIDPILLASLSCALGYLFLNEFGSPALLIWEHEGPGISYGNHLVKYGYGNVYRRPANDRLGAGRTDFIGWCPRGPSKSAMLLSYRRALEQRKFLNPSEDALKECLKFRYTSTGDVEHTQYAVGSSPSGARKNHGDLVIADGLANLAIEDIAASGRTEKKEEETNYSSYQGRMDMRTRADSDQDGWQQTVADSEY